jgi:GC-rich sequence DNA-binding factor
MSDTPVIFKRSKFKANQRAREELPQDAQEQQVQSVEDEPSPSAVASKIRNKARQRVKPKTSLSFGGAEEEVTRLGTVSLFPNFTVNLRKEMSKSSKSKSLALAKKCPSDNTHPL